MGKMGWCRLTVGVAIALAIGLGAEQPSQAQLRPVLADRAEACLTAYPYLATTCYNVPISSRPADMANAVIAFRQSPTEGAQPVLARWGQVGSTWGLAYRNAEEALYAAAFHKRYVTFGPGGPAAIYRIDLRTPGSAAVTHAITVPNAGPDVHTLPLPSRDNTARDWAGKTSLGDIDVSTDESELYAVNLFDRRIYRFELPGGQPLGSFAHGAAGEPWADDARPFGLKFRAGRLFHGVVNSAQSSRSRDDLAAYVYSSAPDGTDLRLETAFDLDYPRGVAVVTALIGRLPPFEEVSLDWLPWKDDYNNVAPDRAGQAVYPQPILSDIEFDDAGNMIIGLKDRQADMALAEQVDWGGRIEKPGLGIGDIVRARFSGGVWRVDPAELAHANRPATITEFFDDFTDLADESSMGGLARLRLADVVVAGTVALRDIPGRMVIPAGTWYDDPTGNRLWRQDIICGQQQPPAVPPLTRDLQVPLPVRPLALARPAPSARQALSVLPPARSQLAGLAWPQHNEWTPSGEVGDIELLCGDAPPPTPTATDVPSPSPTATAPITGTPPPTAVDTPPPTIRPSVTPSPTPPPTATPEPFRIYVPILVKQELCVGHADVVLVLDMSSSMERKTESGRAKYQAAIDAARLFVDLLDLTGDGATQHDQVGVVGFNDRDWIESGLTNNRPALHAALGRLPRQIREGTRLDLAFEAGQRAMAGPGRKPENLPVMIVLTDGIPNRIPFPPGSSEEEVVLAAARAAKDKGSELFTIGLGLPEDILEWLLQAAASDPPADHYFYAPSAEDLAAIYRQIARLLPCPGTEPWPPRPPERQALASGSEVAR